MSTNESDAEESTECPTCGDEFGSERGMKIHHGQSHKESTYECAWCGAKQEASPSRIERAENLFCDGECHGEWTSENRSGEDSQNYSKERVECDNCGDELLRQPSHISARNFCDKSCYSNYRGENQICDWSGSDEVVYPRSISSESTCPECGDGFESFRGVGTHLRTTHDITLKLEDKCAVCGDSVVRTPNRFNGDDALCSTDCREKHLSNIRSGKVEVECGYCGSTILRAPCHVERSENLFCGTECHAGWKSENVVGEDHPNWEGGYSKHYGPNWSKQRVAEIAAANECCRGCGMSRDAHYEKYGVDLHVHHKQRKESFRGDGGSIDWTEANALQNLAALCYECHGYAEQMAPLYPFGD